MFIRKFEITNFKIHKNTPVELFPITVFVGPNSGGKSAIFDALINFSMVCRGSLAEAFNQFPYSFEAFRHHAASSSARIRYAVELSESPDSDEVLTYSIEFSQMPSTEIEPLYSIHNEELSVDKKVIFSRSRDICDLPDLTDLRYEDRSILAAIRRVSWPRDFIAKNMLLAECALDISKIGRYRLDPTLMARAGKVVEVKPGEDTQSTPAPWLSYHGEDLASVLYFLHVTEDPLLDRITSLVAEGIRGFEGFVFNRVGSDRVGFSAKFSDKRGVVVAPNLSDGTLSMIGLVVLALAPGRPSILCIEEPENGLTPKATRVFYKTIRELAFAEEDAAQILISSHSPFVIVDVWNGDDRNFIYQCHPAEGSAKVEKFSEIVKQVGTLRSGGEIGLALAEQIMDGFRETS
jgi:hypothetical protein